MITYCCILPVVGGAIMVALDGVSLNGCIEYVHNAHLQLLSFTAEGCIVSRDVSYW